MRFLAKAHTVSIGLCLAALSGCAGKKAPDNSTPPIAGVPKNVLAPPIAGSGKSLKISAVFHDDGGAANLMEMFVVINTQERGVDGTGGCAVWCKRTTDDVHLLNDAGNDWLGPRKLRASDELTNSQCTLHLNETGLTEVSGNARLEISVSFSNKFAGPKSIFAKAVNQQKREGNFDLLGTWTVTDR